jgi:hypothetical protein
MDVNEVHGFKVAVGRNFGLKQFVTLRDSPSSRKK